MSTPVYHTPTVSATPQAGIDDTPPDIAGAAFTARYHQAPCRTIENSLGGLLLVGPVPSKGCA